MDRTLDVGVGVLRRPRVADAQRITTICQDPAIQRFTRVPIPYTLADAERFIEATNERWGAGTPAASGNTASQRTAQRVGFRKEGVRRSAAVLRATGGMPRERADMTMWGLLPNEFGTHQ